MSMDFAFVPDAERAQGLDRAMRQGLLDSLEYLAGVLPEENEAVAVGLEKIVRSGRAGACYGPNAFGLYYEATALLLREDWAAAIPVLEALASEAPLDTSSLQVLPLDAVGDQSVVNRYVWMMDSDPDARFGFAKPAAPVADAATRRIESAMQRLWEVTPNLAGEIEALVRQMILVGAAPDASSQFAGGSSYSLWGALFLNADHHSDDMSFIEAIAHESAHSLLFGFCVDEPLVRNADEDRFPSPLRQDDRPMDGIYHATYVSARMHWVLDQMIQSNTLSPDEAALATQKRAADQRNFFDGLQVVEAHGALTKTGAELMSAAKHYMRDVTAD